MATYFRNSKADVTFLSAQSDGASITSHVNSRIAEMMSNSGGPARFEFTSLQLEYVISGALTGVETVETDYEVEAKEALSSGAAGATGYNPAATFSFPIKKSTSVRTVEGESIGSAFFLCIIMYVSVEDV
jgi:hypothetical protein